MTAADAPVIRIDRVLPLPWVLAAVGGLTLHGILTWSGLQQQAVAVKELAAEVRELRSAINSGQAKTAEHAVRIAEHERRLAALEASRGR